MRLLRLFDNALRLAVLAAFCVLIAAVLIQVVTRVALPRSPVWTEELSRFALLYLVALGAPLALRSGDLVNVDFVVSLMPAALRSVLEAAVLLASATFCAYLIEPAWRFMQIGALQSSPALGWSMMWIHLSMVVAPVLLGLMALQRLLEIVVGRRAEDV